MQDPTEDTEWNDILRQHGVLPQRAPSPTAEIEKAIEDAVEQAHANRLEGKSLDELDEIDEEGLEDEEFVQQYRQKRMGEIKQQLSREKFGEVVHISKPEYTTEITEASKTWPVVVHISNPNSVQSKLFAALLQRVSWRFRDIKFVDIDSRQIGERFPPSQCPTIIVYKNGEVVFQQITLLGLGGDSATLRDVDTLLVRSKAVEPLDRRLLANQDEDPDLNYGTSRDHGDSEISDFSD